MSTPASKFRLTDRPTHSPKLSPDGPKTPKRSICCCCVAQRPASSFREKNGQFIFVEPEWVSNTFFGEREKYSEVTIRWKLPLWACLEIWKFDKHVFSPKKGQFKHGKKCLRYPPLHLKFWNLLKIFLNFRQMFCGGKEKASFVQTQENEPTSSVGRFLLVSLFQLLTQKQIQTVGFLGKHFLLSTGRPNSLLFF